MVPSKGKEVAGDQSSGKRKRNDSDKTVRRLKRKNRGVLQFFEDSAYEIDEDEASDDSDFDDDFLEDEFKVKNEPGKAHHLPFLPKEEELSEEELEKMMEERYKPGSSFVTYAEDVYDSKRSIEGNAVIPSSKDPTIWKVKCMVGRERHSAFCLMQKFVDLHSLGTKLQIISAFALDHVKGFIYMEAERQSDVNEACKGLCTIYSSRVAPVPKNEVSHLLSVRSKYNEVSVGTWARVKSGKYKGDLAQVIAVNDARKKATVKLIPRIDLQAMAEKFGGGIASKKTATPTSKKLVTPTPRLISSSELEEFRPLIQYRRDRDTGLAFEVLDGLMLKDGYLYKKVSVDSLSFWGVMPSKDELLKFEPSKKEESDCQEWLTQLYGEQKKKRVIKSDKGGGKGEGSSGSSMASSFEVHDFVFFGRKDFGIIVGTEKDDNFRILKEGSEGPVVMTVELHALKNGSFDKKFTALDHRKKTISMNDTVSILEGPLQGRQGIVKQIYRGTIFLYDENEQENSGYICCKSQICEKIKLSDDACKGKGGESGLLSFEDFSSSPKSPLSPKKDWQTKENSSNFQREDKDGMFSIGQSLRIRVGPLKGYLCRVLAIRRSDVTVKLDSQQKILTVKSEHLAEVRGKSSAISLGDDADTIKPFDLLGTQDGSTDWMAGAGTSAEGDRWGAGGLSTERSSWPALSTSGSSLQQDSNSANPLISVNNDTSKDVGDAWESKVTPKQNSSWARAVPDEKAASNSEQVGGWGKGEDSWKNGTANPGFGSVASESWCKAIVSSGDQAGTSKDAGDNWNIAKLKSGTPDSSNDAAPIWGKKINQSNSQDGGWKKSEEPFDKGKNATENLTGSWSNATAGKNQLDSWGKGKAEPKNQSGGWGDAGGNLAQSEAEATGWKKATTVDGGQTGSWGNMKKDGGSTVGGNDGSSWGKATTEAEATGWKRATTVEGGQTGSWGNMKKDGGSTGGGNDGPGWGKALESQDRSTGKGTEENSWGKAAEKCSNKDASGNKAVWHGSTSAPESQTGGWGNAGGSSWNKQEGGSSWNKQAGGSSWSNQVGGSSWNKQTDVNTEDESKGRKGQNDSWGKPSGGDRGFGGWNKNRMGNNDDTDQQESWERTQTFDGGRGSGGRRGRGGSRGGRDQFGRGRSFGRGQSSGWSKEGEEYHVKDSWGNGKDGGSDRSGFGGSKAGWNSSTAAPENQAGGWSNAGGKLAQSEAEESGWKKSTVGDGGQTGGWGNTKKDGGAAGWGSGGSSWGKAMNSQDRSTGKGTEEDSWGKAANNWSNKDGSSGTKAVWNSSTGSKGVQNETMAAPENQAGGWSNTGGNLTQSEAEGSGWKKSMTGDGRQTGGWGNTKQDGGLTGWGGGGSSWGKAMNSQDRSIGKGTQDDSSGKAAEIWSGKDSSSGTKVVWNSSTAAPENQTQGWGNAGGSSWNKQEGGSWNKQGGGSSWSQAGGSSWTKQTDMNREESKEGADQKGSWGKPTGGDRGYGGWDKSGMGNKDDAGQQESWERTKTFDGGRGSGGRRGRGGRDQFGRGRSFGRGQSSGWGEEGQEYHGHGTSDGTSSANLSSWSGGQGIGWGRGKGFDGDEDNKSDTGGYGGRGGSDRGGFGGRGRSDRGGYGGRGGFERGGFRGRGSSERGGFGGRGRGRRDQNGDWSSRNDSHEDKPPSWNKGWSSSNEGGGSWNQGSGDKGQSWNSGWKPSKGALESGGGADGQAGGWNQGTGSGWKSNEGGGSWNQGGGDKGQSWNSGGKPSKGALESGGGSDSQAGGWNPGTGSGWKTNGGGSWNQGGGDKGQSWNAGWKPSKGAPESGGGADAQAGGWNQGTGSAKDAGGSDVAASGWTKQASSWNKGNGSANGGTSGTRNQMNAADGGEASGWNQPKDAKGASEDGGPSDPWGKAAGSSWGKGNDGGRKGGW